MKNLKYFPFARSRYFYGKLLTVDDFETEQKYMNDKRRMVNRFLHGSGVVCGMNVVRVDDRTISVEMGLALDFAGREIVTIVDKNEYRLLMNFLTKTDPAAFVTVYQVNEVFYRPKPKRGGPPSGEVVGKACKGKLGPV